MDLLPDISLSSPINTTGSSITDNAFIGLILELKNTLDVFYTKNPETSPDLGIMINRHYAERIKGLIENPGNGAQLLYGDVSKINLEKNFIPSFLFGFDNFEQMAKSELAKLFTKVTGITEEMKDTYYCEDCGQTFEY